LIKNKNIFLIVAKRNFLRAESRGVSSHQEAEKDDKMREGNNLGKIKESGTIERKRYHIGGDLLGDLTICLNFPIFSEDCF
jgi:hypothetical protein